MVPENKCKVTQRKAVYHSKRCKRREVEKRRKTTEVVATRVNYGKWQIVQAQHTVHTVHNICVSNLFFVLCSVCCTVIAWYTFNIVFGYWRSSSQQPCILYLFRAHAARLFAFDISSILFRCFARSKRVDAAHEEEVGQQERKKAATTTREKQIPLRMKYVRQ